jgi:hypothetical protein
MVSDHCMTNFNILVNNKDVPFFFERKALTMTLRKTDITADKRNIIYTEELNSAKGLRALCFSVRVASFTATSSISSIV